MYKEIKEKIKELEGIINCKITGEEKIDEIHIIADKRRDPKKIVRDIETMVLVNLNQEIDHKKISIAQVDSKDDIEINGNRIIINSIYKEHNRPVIHLHLEINDKPVEKEIADDRDESIPLMIARGIIDLIELHTDFSGKIRTENVFTTGFNNEIVIVQLTVYNTEKFNQEKLLGAVFIDNNLPLAIGKACLKALNRIVNC